MGRYRRRLPHIHETGQTMFVTFRLAGCLPESRVFGKEVMGSGRSFVCMDRLLDDWDGGPVYLKIGEVAGVVEDGILRGAEADYHLHAWVIMPNHVHLLMTTREELTGALRRLKGRTARGANRVLGMRGAFWQAESYDRVVRSREEFGKVESYILRNPVRAGGCPNRS